jgi:hypothetical protein
MLRGQDEAAMLRRALAESGRQLRLAHSDAGAMVDRRIVTKLLVTYFERGRRDADVLGLMARMLGFTGARAGVAYLRLAAPLLTGHCHMRVSPSHPCGDG